MDPRVKSEGTHAIVLRRVDDPFLRDRFHIVPVPPFQKCAGSVEEEAGKPVYEQLWTIRLSKHTEEDYYRKEARKGELKRMIAKVKGLNFKESEIGRFRSSRPSCSTKTTTQGRFQPRCRRRRRCRRGVSRTSP